MDILPLLNPDGLRCWEGLLRAVLGWTVARLKSHAPALPTAHGEGTSLLGPRLKPKRGRPRSGRTNGVGLLTPPDSHVRVLRLGLRGNLKMAFYERHAALEPEPYPLRWTDLSLGLHDRNVQWPRLPAVHHHH